MREREREMNYSQKREERCNVIFNNIINWDNNEDDNNDEPKILYIENNDKKNVFFFALVDHWSDHVIQY